MTKEQVKAVLPPGSKVRLRHLRVTADDTGAVLPRGGWTIAEAITPGDTQLRAEAVCSARDNFSKKIGRDIALGRLLKLAGARSLSADRIKRAVR